MMNLKHFSGRDVENIIEVILSDEKLFKYALNLVMQRINKNVLHDTAWCIQLIDLSIDHVLAEVDVLGILHHYIQTDNFEEKVEDAMNLYPNFSFTEPTFQNSPSRHSNSDILKQRNSPTENILTIEIEDRYSFVEGESNLINVSCGNDSEASTVRMVVENAMTQADSVSYPHISLVDSSSNSDSSNKLGDSLDENVPNIMKENLEETGFQSIEKNETHKICEHSLDSIKAEKKRVSFTDSIISQVFYRDKTDPIEKHQIYYSHEEEDYFTRQQSREYLKADAMGITWIEWINLYAEQDAENSTNFNDSDQYDEDYFEDSIDHF